MCVCVCVCVCVRQCENTDVNKEICTKQLATEDDSSVARMLTSWFMKIAERRQVIGTHQDVWVSQRGQVGGVGND